MPSAGRPSTILGPVQPFGVRSTIIGQRGRAPAPRRRAPPLDRGDPVQRLGPARRPSLVHGVRVVALDEDRLVAVARAAARELVHGIRASTVGLAIL